MPFSDISFIFVFFPLFLLLYYPLPYKYKNAALLIGSATFYLYACKDHPVYMLILPIETAVALLCGIGVRKRGKKVVLTTSLIALFGVLAFFKYFGGITGKALPLPPGLSFYTFQMAAYCVDCYRGNARPQKSYFGLLNYFCMFPYLLSGPLVSYSEIGAQLRERTISFEKSIAGLRRFIIGLSLKLLIADRVGGLWREAAKIGYDSLSTPQAWLAILAFSLQLYFDFYGYSLMAKGVGGMLGFDIPDNFNDPYTSKSMTEFWRRWHITLGKWFRNYLYIPLGGNRRGKVRTIINLAAVWILTGVWHGATINFLLWGLVLFLAIAIEKLFLMRFLKKWHVLPHIYMAILLAVSWTLFACEPGQTALFLSRLFIPNTGIASTLTLLKDYGLYLVVGVVFSTPLPKKIWGKFSRTIFGSIILCALLALSVYVLCQGLNDPFMYFNF